MFRIFRKFIVVIIVIKNCTQTLQEALLSPISTHPVFPCEFWKSRHNLSQELGDQNTLACSTAGNLYTLLSIRTLVFSSRSRQIQQSNCNKVILSGSFSGEVEHPSFPSPTTIQTLKLFPLLFSVSPSSHCTALSGLFARYIAQR